MIGAIKRRILTGIAALAAVPSLHVGANAAQILYGDRATFESAVGTTITDGFTAYGPKKVLTDQQMSSVLGETTFKSLTFTDLNLVGDGTIYSDGTTYCAGCNGNFLLGFKNTSLSNGGGVLGVGIDIVLHTSRHSSLGDIIPGDPSVDGTVGVTFANGSTQTISVPADVGFFGPGVFFLGLTDTRQIASIQIGMEPTSQRHFWDIDNLTIAGAIPSPPVTPVPEPSTLALIGSGLAGAAALRRRKRN